MTLWNLSVETYNDMKLESRRVCLHPYLRRVISRGHFRRIFDYGCGDGSLFESWDYPFEEVALFDKSSLMRDILRRKFQGSRGFSVIHDIEDVAAERYDVVALCLVLMTIPSLQEQRFVFSQIRRIKTRDGLLVVAITHPCFRQFEYSTFETQFTRGVPFNYNRNGRAFLVELRDNGKRLQFQDYHWKLSTTFNLIVSTGFSISRMIELGDGTASGEYGNPFVPPYLILCCM